MDTLLLAGGCFWGMEELFRSQPGVVATTVGYMGGKNENPTYEFHTGHAEAIKIDYDPLRTSPDVLFDYFFTIHDPTTRNKQGNDIGVNYRSTIFYFNDIERQSAEQAIKRNQLHWKDDIVTTLEPATTFWIAEEEHQDFLRKHPGGYTCHYERNWA